MRVSVFISSILTIVYSLIGHGNYNYKAIVSPTPVKQIVCQADFSQKLSQPVTILPLGDSLTHGVIDPSKPFTNLDGYRKDLFDTLQSNHIAIDFIGPLESGEVDWEDKNHAGYDGNSISDITEKVNTQLSLYKPQVVLLWVGTNDISHNIDRDHAIDRMQLLIQLLRKTFPQSYIYVASLPPTKLQGLDSLLKQQTDPRKIAIVKDEEKVPEYIDSFNKLLQKTINEDCQKDGMIRFVGMNSLTFQDTNNGSHLTENGYKKAAGDWYTSLQPLFSFSFATPSASPKIQE